MRHTHLERRLFKQGLVNSPWVLICKQASETPSHIPCSCEALATLKFRHLSHNFMQPGDSEDIFVSKTLHFAQGVGVLNKWAKGLRKISITVKVHRSLSARPSVFYPIQFYSILQHSEQMTCSFSTLCMYIYLCIQQIFQSINMVSCRRRNQESVTFQTCWKVTNVQRKFLILLTVDHQPQMKAVILILVTRKMYSYLTLYETVTVVFMLVCLTLISCGRIWEIMPNIKKFLLDYVHVKIVLKVKLTLLILTFCYGYCTGNCEWDRSLCIQEFRNSTGNVFPTQMWVMKCSQWRQKKYIPYGQFLCLWVLYKNIFWECISHVASWQPCQWLVLLVQFTDLKGSVDLRILSTTATRTHMKDNKNCSKCVLLSDT